MKKTFLFALSAVMLFASCKKDNDKQADTYTVDSESSLVTWQGYLANDYYNEGTFSVSQTDIKVRDGKVEGGTFTIPILSLDVINLEGEAKGQLEAHLKSPDFFDIMLYPNARFEITKMEAHTPTDEDAVEGANTRVTGKFTMLGVTKTISFPARIDVGSGVVEVEALFSINRLDWGMDYASDPDAGDEHYILPTVDLHLQVVAEKN